ncbi:gephyrin-like molybdotransferase Glp [Sedimenticola thiotaurini]|uniref:Molybdopterin molybdenumtransferase n=1 Tax=Sedimenticola thiotaurini TaxID=1543721 RepID=A0A0F7K265_9GAMM|nr:gephyrin-like molybdotransferase Glp [Sedimenticola thiotaurini]AKH21290.1 molybdenum cofactor biosynthesis protein MoaA [Sedimenticola thiotaurini]
MSDCGCSSVAEPSMKPLEEALALLLSHAQAVPEYDTVSLAEANGRVLAEPVISQINMPPWDNSAMDGYAVNTADLNETPCTLPVSQRIPAGAAPEPLAAGTAARIFTGAPVPPNADAVVIQEVCEQQGDQVTIRQSAAPGANIRNAGEDTRIGQKVLQAGTRLGAQHIGLAASVGVSELTVYRRLKVALFSSGDELISPGQPLGPGQIYNSNEYTLRALLQALGCEIISLGIVKDTFEATCDALSRAAGQADLVMTSGGVSVGEEDHLKPAVEALGSLDLWKIAIRPGKPLAFGHIQGTPFIGTPGNPVSLFVTFCLFARPFILKRQGVREAEQTPTPILARADFDWPKAEKRREFARAQLNLDAQGEAQVSLYSSRSSGVLNSLTWANGLAILPEQQTLVRGDMVQFLPFSELLK